MSNHVSNPTQFKGLNSPKILTLVFYALLFRSLKYYLFLKTQGSKFKFCLQTISHVHARINFKLEKNRRTSATQSKGNQFPFKQIPNLSKSLSISQSQYNKGRSSTLFTLYSSVVYLKTLKSNTRR